MQTCLILYHSYFNIMYFEINGEFLLCGLRTAFLSLIR